MGESSTLKPGGFAGGSSLLSSVPHSWPRKNCSKVTKISYPARMKVGGGVTPPGKNPSSRGLAHGKETKEGVMGKDVSSSQSSYQAGKCGRWVINPAAKHCPASVSLNEGHGLG